MAKIPIGGRLHSTATGNIVTGANEIFDDDKNKKQSIINQEIDNRLTTAEEAIAGIESGNFVNINAIATDANIAAVFTRIGIIPAANTVYRVGSWKGDDGYNVEYYTDYSYNNGLVVLGVVNRGVDDEPTAGSNNLVKSDGVYNEFSKLNQFTKFVLDVKISNWTGYEQNMRLAVCYIYKNTANYGSGIYVRNYNQNQENVSSLSQQEIYWQNLEGVKAGVETLSGNLKGGGTIQLTINWDVIPDGFNGLLQTPITLSNDLNNKTKSLETSVTQLEQEIPALNQFTKFVLDFKIGQWPVNNRRVAICYLYKNDVNYGSGVFLRYYEQNEDNVSSLDVSKVITYWERMEDEKSGVETLTSSNYNGIELTVNWDVIPDGFNSLLPTPITLSNDANKVVGQLQFINNVIFGGNILNNNFGAINWYLPYNDGYGSQIWQGQMTSSRLTAKINGIFIGPLKPTISSTSDTSFIYEIYKSSEETPAPTGKTLIKTGTIEFLDKTTFKEYFVEIPETELENEFVYVYISQYIEILGRTSSAIPKYIGDNVHQVIFNLGSNWYFGSGSYDVVSPRCVFSLSYPKYFEKIIDEKIANLPINIESIQINLPNKLYAVVGDTLQVFYRSIIEAVNPYIYDIRVICNKGQGFPRYFSYTPTINDIGTETLTICLYNNDGRIVGEQSCELVTVASPSSPSSIKKIFTFGDSLTSGGEWPNETQRRLVNTNSVDGIIGKGLSNIDFCGQFEVTRNEQTTKYFGVGGWVWANYTNVGRPAFRFQVSGVTNLNIGSVYSNNGHNYTIMEVNVTSGTGNILCQVASSTDTPETSGILTKVSGIGDDIVTFTSFSADSQNPLWDYNNNVMTFIPYVNQYGNGQCDAVYVLLSWNGQSAWKTYDLDDSTQISYAKTFARKLHSEYPNAKLKIIGIQMPSLNGGLAANYGANSGYSDVFGLYKCAWSYNRALQELCNNSEFSNYCEFVDAATQFDSENNMQSTQYYVNIRNTKTEVRGTNGVHPAINGYYQIADAVYRNFVANFCQ